ncbi:glycine-rich protein A3 [Canna indica]|uniref:Glycine-rich protein A3 n=1 Tax=Canna indica TaxID=4628 RepID=A0AAQ3QGJ6_9LILI|nr:glycine-rich protein A3 [Canna indica]
MSLFTIQSFQRRKMGGEKDQHGTSDKGLCGQGFFGYPAAGYPPPPQAYAYAPAPAAYPSRYGCPPQGYPQAQSYAYASETYAYAPTPVAYPPPYGCPPPQGYPPVAYPPRQAGHGSSMGALLAGGAAAATAYGAHKMSHGSHHGGYAGHMTHGSYHGMGGYAGHMPGRYGKFKHHGKFKHGKFGKHMYGGGGMFGGKFKKWKY